jgi:DNA topoisomerase-3
MHEIADMTKRIVMKAKEYDRDTVPGDYATLKSPCPNCGGVVQETYRRYNCVGKPGQDACGFSFTKIPAGPRLRAGRGRGIPADKRIGPLQGFRSKAGWPFTAELALAYDEEEKNWKLEFDFGEDKNAETGEIVDFSAQEPLGPCPKCGHKVFEWGSNYVCEKRGADQ